MDQKIPIQTLHLFPVLDDMLISLLRSLTTEEWKIQTVAKRWKVKDVAAHLLDGNLRSLSTSRDHYFGEQAENISSYQDLVNYLNNLNLTWTNAAKRLSPQILIQLLEITGQEYTRHLNTLQPFDDAIFPVAWAGQETSPNWFHIAREYTEKFLHQQQIRDALGNTILMTKELFYPFLDTFMYALPYTFRNIPAENDVTVSVVVTTNIGGEWNITRHNTEWRLTKTIERAPDATLEIDPGTAWKLFSKSLTPREALPNINIRGNEQLATQALQMVAVMG